jgi:2'-5' RNA ligase
MRMFIASPISLNQEIKSSIINIFCMENARSTEFNNIHLTYLFLGDINLTEANHIKEELKKISVNKFTAKISVIIAFPDTGHPRVIVMFLESLYIYNLYNSIIKLFPAYDGDRRKFMPHITIARIRKGSACPDLSNFPVHNSIVEINEVCLFMSLLNRSRVVYEKVSCRGLL